MDLLPEYLANWQIDAIKFERTQIYFCSDVFTTIVFIVALSSLISQINFRLIPRHFLTWNYFMNWPFTWQICPASLTKGVMKYQDYPFLVFWLENTPLWNTQISMLTVCSIERSIYDPLGNANESIYTMIHYKILF